MSPQCAQKIWNEPKKKKECGESLNGFSCPHKWGQENTTKGSAESKTPRNSFCGLCEALAGVGAWRLNNSNETAANCSANCANNCGNNVVNNPGWRAALLGLQSSVNNLGDKFGGIRPVYARKTLV